MSFENEVFTNSAGGVLCLLPYLNSIQLDQQIIQSDYPETKSINKVRSILSFIALKVSSIRRYSADDLWCMDRGLGLFAGLNVLPKTSWYSSYSHRITRENNLFFLKTMHQLWKEKKMLSDTVNLDFTTIPYWGDDAHLENNWSGKKHCSLSSISAVLAHDPETGIIDYSDSNVRHKTETKTVLEFLDFYRSDGSKDIKHLVFDSKFTTYENLGVLDKKGIKFITIRRRGKTIINQLESLDSSKWIKKRIMKANGKGRTIKVYEDMISLPGYCQPIRQLAITGHGKLKPALIITNDVDLSLEKVIQKYAIRWLVENEISDFDNVILNRVSSSIVVKVDFDLTRPTPKRVYL